MKPSHFIHRIYHRQNGSFTLESTIIIPFILICTILVIFTALYIYQVAYLHSSSGIAAERAAFNWGNSHKDPLTGRVAPNQDDGLYWRLSNDLFSAGLGLLGLGRETKLDLPLQSAESPGLMDRKLAGPADDLPAGTQGEIRFASSGVFRKVQVGLKDYVHIPFNRSKWAVSGQASYITEPVEWIRVIDLTRSYAGTIKDKISPKKAGELFQERGKGSNGSSVTITSEREAAHYLRKLVSGKEVEVTTSSGAKRLVDAMDENGIVHQAYYTFTNKQLLEVQMPKDLDLLTSDPNVKGVVWHFFKGGSSPSKKLRQQLERAGIIVVIHE